MTQREFFKLLAATSRKWRVESSGDLRCAKGDCPVTAVYRKAKRRILAPHQYEIAASRMGLAKDFAVEVAFAADQISDNFQLRDRLLRVCGVK